MNQATKRLIYISTVVLVVVAGIVFFWSQNDNKTTVSEIAPPAKETFQIKNLKEYSKDINAADQEKITASIDKYVKQTSPTQEGYTGAIRASSYVKTNPTPTAINITFLVDIETAKQTYKVSLGKDSSTGENSLYILCPEKSELIYPKFNCKDDINDS